MKRIIPILLVLPLLTSVSKTERPVFALSDLYGGTINFDFSKTEDKERFSLYSSFYSYPVVNGDAFCSYLYSEQKIILRDPDLTDYLIEADFAPAVLNGHIDMGFYLAASNPGNEVDHINALNLQIKHDPDLATWFLRIYEFKNSVYQGEKIVVGDLPYWKDEWLHLSALVKDGWITAFINNDYETPILSYYAGNTRGMVGIRSFKSPAKVKNLSITAPEFDINFDELDSLLSEYQSLEEEEYTNSTWNEYSSICNEARVKEESLTNQLQINDYVKSINKAKENLVISKTYDDLQFLIEECDKITDSSLYTRNSYESFLFCLNRAKTLTRESSNEEISNEYKMLLDRKENLIKYGGIN